MQNTKNSRAPKGSVQLSKRGQMCSLRFTFGGRRQYFATGIPWTLAGQRKAKAIALQMESDILNESFDSSLKKYRIQPEKQILTPHDLFTLWMGEQVARVDGGTLSSYEAAASHIKGVSDILTTEAAQSLLDERLGRLAVETYGRYLRFYRSAWAWAIEQGYVEFNPFDGVKKRRASAADTRRKHSKKPFTPDEISRILAEAIRLDGGKGRTYNLVVALLSTGARIGELCGLRWGAVDLANGEIKICESLRLGIRKPPKTEKSVRSIPIARPLHEILDRIRPSDWNEDDLVFLTPRGHTLRGDTFARKWRGMLANANVPHRSPHTSRHTVASLLITQGSPLPDVSRILGHSSPRITMEIYAHSLGGHVQMPEILD